MNRKTLFLALAVCAAMAEVAAPATADPRERGEKFKLAAGASLDLFEGAADADFNFQFGAPAGKTAKTVATGANGPVVTIEEVFKTSDADAWYLVDLDGSTHGFVRADQLNAVPVAATLPRQKGLDWWNKETPRDLAAARKASLAEEARISDAAHGAEQEKKFAESHNGVPRAAQLLVGSVCTLGMGKKFTPLRLAASPTAPIQFYLRDGTLVSLKEDTDPVWRKVDAHINDGSVIQGYVTKWALASCFMRMGPLYFTDVPNQILPN